MKAQKDIVSLLSEIKEKLDQIGVDPENTNDFESEKIKESNDDDKDQDQGIKRENIAIGDKIFNKVDGMSGRIEKILSDEQIIACNKYGKFTWQITDCEKK